MKPKSELILYQTEDNRTRIEVRLENETVWLTQAQLAELFQRERSVITKHIRNIFEEGEPVELWSRWTERPSRSVPVSVLTFDTLVPASRSQRVAVALESKVQSPRSKV